MMLDFEEDISIYLKLIKLFIGHLYLLITFAPVNTLENNTKISWK